MGNYFIAGTDTGVGKTYVLSLMLKWAVSRGMNCFVMKPVETGCRKEAGTLIPEDAVKLAEAAGLLPRLGEVCPFRYEAPAAPYVAAKLEGKAVDVDVIRKIAAGARSLSQAGSQPLDHLFVEGAGGLMVPVTRELMMIDIPPLLGLTVILVSRLGLGAVNHTLLSMNELRRRNIPVAGVILNDCEGAGGIAEQTNPGVLEEFLGAPLLGVVPCGFDQPETLGRVIDLEFLIG